MVGHLVESHLTYSREELLKIKQNSLSTSKPSDWNHIDNTLLHNTTAESKRTQAKLSAALSCSDGQRQRQIPVIIGTKSPYSKARKQSRGVSYSNLITIPTYSSITDMQTDRFRKPSTLNCEHAGLHVQGSTEPHNGHPIDPRPHTIVRIDTGAHKAPVREPPVRAEEADDDERRKICRASEVPASSEKLAAPAAGLTPHRPPNSTPLPKVYMHNMRSINLDKFGELKLIASEYDLIMLSETWLTDSKENLYKLDGFKLHTCNRGNKRMGGGVATYVKDHLPAQKLYSHTTSHTSTYGY
jgi:hypothetical protein